MHKELIRFLIYVAVGLFTTLCTWLVWNLLIIVNNWWLGWDTTIWFSSSQYISAIIMIYPSFYLHRISTFRDREDRHQDLRVTTGRAYLIYLIAPLLASIIIFVFNLIFPQFIKWTIILSSSVVPIGQIILQIVGLGCSVGINFFGQKHWLYK